LDGLGLIEALKRNPRLSEIPVIMITSRSERVHREKAFALGAAKFLTKPIEGGELKSIINSLCLVEA
jgi:CheY-like chemotaxis protein